MISNLIESVRNRSKRTEILRRGTIRHHPALRSRNNAAGSEKSNAYPTSKPGVVDEVNEVTGISVACISPPPRMIGEDVCRYLTGVVRLPSSEGGAEKILLTLDPAEILGKEEFDSLAQAAE